MADAEPAVAAAVGQVAIVDPAQKQERCGRAIRRAMQGDPSTWSRFSTADTAVDSNRSQAENLAAEIGDLLLDYDFGMLVRGIQSCVENTGQGRHLVGAHLSALVKADSWSPRRVDWGIPVAGVYVPRKESDLSVLQAVVDDLDGDPSFAVEAAAAERSFQSSLLTTWVTSIPAKLDPNEDTRLYETVLTCVMTKDPAKAGCTYREIEASDVGIDRVLACCRLVALSLDERKKVGMRNLLSLEAFQRSGEKNWFEFVSRGIRNGA